MIDELKRRAAADPQSRMGEARVLSERARIEGPSVYLECLVDRDAWSKQTAFTQDMAALVVAGRLGGDWEFKGMRVWSCENRKDCDKCGNMGRDKSLGFCQYCNSFKGTHLETISHRLATFIHNPTGIEFQLLPGRQLKGEWSEDNQMFIVSPSRYVSRLHYNEKNIAPFLIARGPVTHAQFGRGVLGEDRWVVTDLPQTNQNIGAVKAWLGFKNTCFSLPSPSQWEYACKAGSNTRFYWGDEFDESHVWYAGNSCPDCNERHPEDSICWEKDACDKRPHAPAEHDKAGKWNAFGLVDMIGNVWEWNSDGKFSGFSFKDGEREIQARSPLSWSGGDFQNVGFRPIKTIPEME